MERGVILVTLCSVCSAATIHVDDDAVNDPGPGDPTVSSLLEDGSHAHPFDDVQEAIDAAADGDTVLVAPGEYVVTEPLNYNRMHAPEDPGSPPVKNITVQGRAGAGETRIRKTEGYDHDRGSVVIFESGETQSSVLEGFTLTGGDKTEGSGVTCIASSPAVVSCTIAGNVAGLGGGVLCDDSSPRLTDCTICENTAGLGGGVYCTGDSSPNLSSCTIVRNGAVGGGGVYCDTNATPTLRNCRIVGNAAGDGGGVYCSYDARPSLINCTIIGNAAPITGGGGGGLWCIGSAPALTNCTIAGNWARGDGAGISCNRGSTAQVTNCPIYGNRAGDDGGGVYCSRESRPRLMNCTIADNTARDRGDDVCCLCSNPVLGNCIIRGSADAPVYVCGDSDPSFTYCCISRVEVWLGEGNLSTDPLFARNGAFDFSRFETVPIGEWTWEMPNFIAEDPDYHLQDDSPCIDTGRSEGAPATDVDGYLRPCGAAFDIGAFEAGRCRGPERFFVRGDANADGGIDISDAIYSLRYVLGGARRPPCMDTADANDDGLVNLADVMRILRFLFVHQGPLPEPFGACGVDSTMDTIGCDEYPYCDRR